MDYEKFNEQMEDGIEEMSEEISNGNIGKAIIIGTGLAVTYVSFELWRGLKWSKMETAEKLKIYEDKRNRYVKRILEERLSEKEKEKLYKKINKCDMSINEIKKGA